MGLPSASRCRRGRRVINGFITFDTLGSNESQSSNIRDQNEVAFKKKYNKLAKEIKEFIEGTLIKQAQNPQNATASYSIADEILKYKNLLDMGAITRAEYEKLKNQLLNL